MRTMRYYHILLTTQHKKIELSAVVEWPGRWLCCCHHWCCCCCHCRWRWMCAAVAVVTIQIMWSDYPGLHELRVGILSLMLCCARMQPKHNLGCIIHYWWSSTETSCKQLYIRIILCQWSVWAVMFGYRAANGTKACNLFMMIAIIYVTRKRVVNQKVYIVDGARWSSAGARPLL